MKRIKELWDELGEDRLPMKGIAAAVTVLTMIQLFVLDVPTELDALTVLLNGLLILLAIDDEED